MVAIKFLVLILFVAALLPPGREMLDELVREFSRSKSFSIPGSLTASASPTLAGSLESGVAGDLTGAREFAPHLPR